MTDIFKFWSLIDQAETIHPLDRPIFDRLKDSHGFDMRCLPSNFGGKLRTAPIVLLYLSPGFSETDVRIDAINDKVAIANIGAYHSRTFTDHRVLAALPSSRAMLDQT